MHDSQVAGQLIDQVSGEHLVADKGYDSEEIREKARTKNMVPVIPKRSNSKTPNPEFDLLSEPYNQVFDDHSHLEKHS